METVLSETQVEPQVGQEVKFLHETIFWEEDDPRWSFIKPSEGEKGSFNCLQTVDLAYDAYIWVYTGPRGAGKSLAMTYFAAKAVYLYDARLVSNFPISFVLNRIDGRSTYYEAEPLDFYKLLCFDSDYRHCIILIDEAPDIISHMASMTWKNRLLNIFVRQIRKNMNTLFLGAQQFTLIDKSMRWQTDIIIRCQDAFRKYGSSQGLVRGACILMDVYDNSGQWTGQGRNIVYDGQLDMMEPEDSLELPGKSIWGAYDTYFQQDIFESLKRVDMQMGSYAIRDTKQTEEIASNLRDVAPKVMEFVGKGKISSTAFYKSLGQELSKPEKNRLGLILSACGVEGDLKRNIKDFTNFDIQAFERELAL